MKKLLQKIKESVTGQDITWYWIDKKGVKHLWYRYLETNVLFTRKEEEILIDLRVK